MDNLMFLCLVFLMLSRLFIYLFIFIIFYLYTMRLFIAALRSPAG